MIENPCRAKDPSTCRVHGTKGELSVLRKAAKRAMKKGNLHKYLGIKERMERLTDDEKPAIGSRPRDAVHPVLVYGTLRPDGSNYGYYMEGNTVDEWNVELDGFTMYDGKGFPFLARGEAGSKVTATLTYMDDRKYRRVMEELDNLESFHDDDDPMNGYDRVLHTFEAGGKEVTAWIYVASPSVEKYAKRSLSVITGGDWIKHIAPPVRNSDAQHWLTQMASPAKS